MSRWTLRTRLTVLYGVLFFLAGAVLLGLTYLLVQASLESQLTGGLDTRAAALRAQGVPDDVLEQARRDQEALRDAALGSLLTQGGLALVGVGVAAAGLGWLVAGRALRPLHRITETAQRIAASSGRGLHERLALSGPRDEVRRLGDSFDSMLEQLDRSFDGQRRFVANASHELRTPLALNRALVEVAVTRPAASEDLRQLGTSLLEVNERHERLIDGLLTLADSENAVTTRSPVDLAEVAARVASASMRRSLAPAPTSGDPVLIERLMQNLVDNAVRYNVPSGWVSVRTSVSGDHAVLTVENTGPVVAAYEVESLFQPFRQLGDRRAGPDRGFGLGLSIVRAIAQSHGGTATATPRDGGGLVVTVSLPVGE